MRYLALAVLLLGLIPAAANSAPLRAAVFRFALDDTSLAGPMQQPSVADRHRIELITQQLRAALERSGRYDVLSTQPVATEASHTDLQDCGPCATDLARKLGAQVAVTGWVQKVSDLILNINLVIRDVATGKRLHAGSVDIRGDTDIAWTRGLDFLLEELRLTRPGQ
ncbi:MAG TPA: DUF3280 domain-containing protein [Acetobacteraceae bacterium]|nr:DUF3280 domain-containing protein [Acetobacteraceae bacterium]